MTFTATNALSGTATTAITVTNVDRAPVVTAPATVNGSENSLITFGVTASDPDGDTIASLTYAPPISGATFTPTGPGAATFSWTPSFTQAGTYNETFTATTVGPSGSASTQIIVANTDRAPVVAAPATASGAENTLITFTVTASDPDGDAITSLTANGTLPTGATFTAGAGNTSGTFSWTPTFTQAGIYSVVFTASNVLSGTAITAITVTNVDRAPTVTAPATASGPENALLTITVTASDADHHRTCRVND